MTPSTASVADDLDALTPADCVARVEQVRAALTRGRSAPTELSASRPETLLFIRATAILAAASVTSEELDQLTDEQWVAVGVLVGAQDQLTSGQRFLVQSLLAAREAGIW